MRAAPIVIVGLLATVAACGSGSPESPTTANPICTAWTTMLEAQPAGDATDDGEIDTAFTAYADEVGAAAEVFEGGAAETLERYEAAIRAYAADPSDEDAIAELGQMVGPVSVVARGVAGVCGVDVAEGR